MISPYESIASYGVRIVSSVLKEKGFEIGIFFIPLPFDIEYPEALLSGLIKYLREYDIVGVSLTTNYFDRAVQLTQRLKKEGDWKIIWGGIHPTLEPEECLEYADIVVMGESELSFPQLLTNLKEGVSIEGIRGIAYKVRKGAAAVEVRKNPAMPLIENLDEIPFPDYSFKEHYLWNAAPAGIGGQGDRGYSQPLNKKSLQAEVADKWVRLTPELVVGNTGGDYLTLSSRGCPYLCTFCGNKFLKDYYKGESWFRKRTIENLLEEINHVKRDFPFFKRIYFDDDAFMERSLEELTLFSTRMKTETGLPFVVTGVTPRSLTEENLEVLIEGGLKWIRIGVQTISDRVNKDIYHRPMNAKEIRKAVEIIRQYHKKMEPVWYDFIIDNPWETTQENLQTLRFMLELPRPFAVCIYSLTYFPGTQLFSRAVEAGIIRDRQNQVYRKSYKNYKESYVNNLFMFFTLSRLPKWVLKLFVNRWIIASGLYRPLWRLYTFLRDWKARWIAYSANR